MAATALSLSASEQRHRIIAHNIANLEVAGFKARRVDVGKFQEALGNAVKERGNQYNENLEIRGDDFESTPSGGVLLRPMTEGSDSILFHDGSVVSLEQEMTEMARNTMWFEMLSSLHRGQFDGLRKSIRGTAA
jgi:flagellar basal-body rod protein FlgB